MAPASRFLFFAACITLVVAPPPRVREDEKAKDHDKVQNVAENEVYDALDIEYNRYLQEVVQALEGDDKFRKMLENVKPEDIKNGKIADSLDLVSLNVRSKLDEIKRTEVERLRQLAMLEHERNEGVDSHRIKVPGHVDYIRPDKFGNEDLKKLMQQTHKDLEEADRKRKEEFKRYEMDKQYKFQQELNKLPEEEKAKLKQKHEEEIKKHKEHPKIHHPGSKQQLEEVWEKQDHLDPQDFNPKTLFYMHDLDGNGYLDQEEVKLLFRNEIHKAYDPNAPEDDIHEMEEDLERMREHVFNESDTNKDALISFDEFMSMVKRPDFEQDPEWQGVEDEEMFSSQEFMEYERMRQEEFARMQAAGHLPPPPPHEYYGYQGAPIQPHAVPAGVPQPAYHPPPVGQGHPPYQQQGHPAQYAPQAGHPQAYQQMPPQGQAPPQYGQPPQYGNQPVQGMPVQQQQQNYNQQVPQGGQNQQMPQQQQPVPPQGSQQMPQQPVQQQQQPVPQQGQGQPQPQAPVNQQAPAAGVPAASVGGGHNQGASQAQVQGH